MPILNWAVDREMCQANATPTSVKRCPIVASWCVTLGQLDHFHVCSEHGLVLLADGRPYFQVRRIEDCPVARAQGREPPPGEGLRLI